MCARPRASDAEEAFTRVFGQILRCISNANVVRSPGQPVLGQLRSVGFASGIAVKLRSANLNVPSLAFDVLHTYRIVNDATRAAPFRISTVAYQYRLLDHLQNELICFHWNREPEAGGRSFPHVHMMSTLRVAGYEGQVVLRPSHHLHIPTRRILLESVIRFLIEDFEIEPRVPDWDERLSRFERNFLSHETGHR